MSLKTNTVEVDYKNKLEKSIQEALIFASQKNNN